MEDFAQQLENKRASSDLEPLSDEAIWEEYSSHLSKQTADALAMPAAFDEIDEPYWVNPTDSKEAGSLPHVPQPQCGSSTTPGLWFPRTSPKKRVAWSGWKHNRQTMGDSRHELACSDRPAELPTPLPVEPERTTGANRNKTRRQERREVATETAVALASAKAARKEAERESLRASAEEVAALIDDLDQEAIPDELVRCGGIKKRRINDLRSRSDPQGAFEQVQNKPEFWQRGKSKTNSFKRPVHGQVRDAYFSEKQRQKQRRHVTLVAKGKRIAAGKAIARMKLYDKARADHAPSVDGDNCKDKIQAIFPKATLGWRYESGGKRGRFGQLGPQWSFSEQRKRYRHAKDTKKDAEEAAEEWEKLWKRGGGVWAPYDEEEILSETAGVTNQAASLSDYFIEIPDLHLLILGAVAHVNALDSRPVPNPCFQPDLATLLFGTIAQIEAIYQRTAELHPLEHTDLATTLSQIVGANKHEDLTSFLRFVQGLQASAAKLYGYDPASHNVMARELIAEWLSQSEAAVGDHATHTDDTTTGLEACETQCGGSCFSHSIWSNPAGQSPNQTRGFAQRNLDESPSSLRCPPCDDNEKEKETASLPCGDRLTTEPATQTVTKAFVVAPAAAAGVATEAAVAIASAVGQVADVVCNISSAMWGAYTLSGLPDETGRAEIEPGANSPEPTLEPTSLPPASPPPSPPSPPSQPPTIGGSAVVDIDEAGLDQPDATVASASAEVTPPPVRDSRNLLGAGEHARAPLTHLTEALEATSENATQAMEALLARFAEVGITVDGQTVYYAIATTAHMQNLVKIMYVLVEAGDDTERDRLIFLELVKNMPEFKKSIERHPSYSYADGRFNGVEVVIDKALIGHQFCLKVRMKDDPKVCFDISQSPTNTAIAKSLSVVSKVAPDSAATDEAVYRARLGKAVDLRKKDLMPIKLHLCRSCEGCQKGNLFPLGVPAEESRPHLVYGQYTHRQLVDISWTRCHAVLTVEELSKPDWVSANGKIRPDLERVAQEIDRFLLEEDNVRLLCKACRDDQEKRNAAKAAETASKPQKPVAPAKANEQTTERLARGLVERCKTDARTRATPPPSPTPSPPHSEDESSGTPQLPVCRRKPVQSAADLHAAAAAEEASVAEAASQDAADVAQRAQQRAEEARAALAQRRAELDEASRLLDMATQAREGHRLVEEASRLLDVATQAREGHRTGEAEKTDESSNPARLSDTQTINLRETMYQWYLLVGYGAHACHFLEVKRHFKRLRQETAKASLTLKAAAAPKPPHVCKLERCHRFCAERMPGDPKGSHYDYCRWLHAAEDNWALLLIEVFRQAREKALSVQCPPCPNQQPPSPTPSPPSPEDEGSEIPSDEPPVSDQAPRQWSDEELTAQHAINAASSERPTCQLQGCHRLCHLRPWEDETGRMWHDYCSYTHAQQAMVAARMPNADAPQCAYPGCINNAWKANGEFYRCCGRTHHRELEAAELAALNIATNHNVWPTQASLDALVEDMVIINTAAAAASDAASLPPSLPPSPAAPNEEGSPADEVPSRPDKAQKTRAGLSQPTVEIRQRDGPHRNLRKDPRPSVRSGISREASDQATTPAALLQPSAKTRSVRSRVQQFHALQPTDTPPAAAPQVVRPLTAEWYRQIARQASEPPAEPWVQAVGTRPRLSYRSPDLSDPTPPPPADEPPVSGPAPPPEPGPAPMPAYDEVEHQNTLLAERRSAPAQQAKEKVGLITDEELTTQHAIDESQMPPPPSNKSPAPPPIDESPAPPPPPGLEKGAAVEIRYSAKNDRDNQPVWGRFGTITEVEMGAPSGTLYKVRLPGQDPINAADYAEAATHGLVPPGGRKVRISGLRAHHLIPLDGNPNWRNYRGQPLPTPATTMDQPPLLAVPEVEPQLPIPQSPVQGSSSAGVAPASFVSIFENRRINLLAATPPASDDGQDGDVPLSETEPPSAAVASAAAAAVVTVTDALVAAAAAPAAAAAVVAVTDALVAAAADVNADHIRRQQEQAGSARLFGAVFNANRYNASREHGYTYGSAMDARRDLTFGGILDHASEAAQDALNNERRADAERSREIEDDLRRLNEMRRQNESLTPRRRLHEGQFPDQLSVEVFLDYREKQWEADNANPANHMHSRTTHRTGLISTREVSLTETPAPGDIPSVCGVNPGELAPVNTLELPYCCALQIGDRNSTLQNGDRICGDVYEGGGLDATKYGTALPKLEPRLTMLVLVSGLSRSTEPQPWSDDESFGAPPPDSPPASPTPSPPSEKEGKTLEPPIESSPGHDDSSEEGPTRSQSLGVVETLTPTSRNAPRDAPSPPPSPPMLEGPCAHEAPTTILRRPLEPPLLTDLHYPTTTIYGAPSNPNSPRTNSPRPCRPKPPDTPRPKGNPSPSNPRPGNKRPTSPNSPDAPTTATMQRHIALGDRWSQGACNIADQQDLILRGLQVGPNDPDPSCMAELWGEVTTATHSGPVVIAAVSATFAKLRTDWLRATRAALYCDETTDGYSQLIDGATGVAATACSAALLDFIARMLGCNGGNYEFPSHHVVVPWDQAISPPPSPPSLGGDQGWGQPPPPGAPHWPSSPPSGSFRSLRDTMSTAELMRLLETVKQWLTRHRLTAQPAGTKLARCWDGQLTDVSLMRQATVHWSKTIYAAELMRRGPDSAQRHLDKLMSAYEYMVIFGVNGRQEHESDLARCRDAGAAYTQYIAECRNHPKPGASEASDEPSASKWATESPMESLRVPPGLQDDSRLAYSGGWPWRGTRIMQVTEDGKAEAETGIPFFPCANPRCPCPASYNGEGNKYCCRACENGKACASAFHLIPLYRPLKKFSPCARRNCPCPTSWNGRPGEYCCHKCRKGEPCSTVPQVVCRDPWTVKTRVPHPTPAGRTDAAQMAIRTGTVMGKVQSKLSTASDQTLYQVVWDDSSESTCYSPRAFVTQLHPKAFCDWYDGHECPLKDKGPCGHLQRFKWTTCQSMPWPKPNSEFTIARVRPKPQSPELSLPSSAPPSPPPSPPSSSSNGRHRAMEPITTPRLPQHLAGYYKGKAAPSSNGGGIFDINEEVRRALLPENKDRRRLLSVKNLRSVTDDKKGARCFSCCATLRVNRETCEVFAAVGGGRKIGHILSDGTVVCPLCGVDAVVPASELRSEAELHAWRYLAFFAEADTGFKHESSKDERRESRQTLKPPPPDEPTSPWPPHHCIPCQTRNSPSGAFKTGASCGSGAGNRSLCREPNPVTGKAKVGPQTDRSGTSTYDAAWRSSSVKLHCLYEEKQFVAPSDHTMPQEIWKMATKRLTIWGQVEDYHALARRIQAVYWAENPAVTPTRSLLFEGADEVARRFVQCLLTDTTHKSERERCRTLRTAENVKTIWGAGMNSRRWCMNTPPCDPPSIIEILAAYDGNKTDKAKSKAECPHLAPPAMLHGNQECTPPSPPPSPPLSEAMPLIGVGGSSVAEFCEATIEACHGLWSTAWKVWSKSTYQPGLAYEPVAQAPEVNLPPSVQELTPPPLEQMYPDPPPAPPGPGDEDGDGEPDPYGQDPTKMDGALQSSGLPAPTPQPPLPQLSPLPPFDDRVIVILDGTAVEGVDAKEGPHGLCTTSPPPHHEKAAFKRGASDDPSRGDTPQDFRPSTHQKTGKDKSVQTNEDDLDFHPYKPARLIIDPKDWPIPPEPARILPHIMFCTECGKANTTRCTGLGRLYKSTAGDFRGKWPGCFRGKCCQPNPACYYCRDETPATQTPRRTDPEPLTRPCHLPHSIDAALGLPVLASATLEGGSADTLPRGAPPPDFPPSPPSSPTPEENREEAAEEAQLGEEDGAPPPELTAEAQTTTPPPVPTEMPIEVAPPPLRADQPTLPPPSLTTREGRVESPRPQMPASTSTSLLPLPPVVPTLLAIDSLAVTSTTSDVVPLPGASTYASTAPESPTMTPAPTMAPAPIRAGLETARPETAVPETVARIPLIRPTPARTEAQTQEQPSPAYRAYEASGYDEESLGEMQAQLVTLESKLAQSDQTNRTLTATVNAMLREKQKLQARIAEADQGNTRLLIELNEAQLDIKHLQDKLMANQVEYDSLSSRATDMGYQLDLSKQREQELQRNNEQVVNYRNSLLASEDGSVTERMKERMKLESFAEGQSKLVTEAEEVIEALYEERSNKQAQLDQALSEVADLKQARRDTPRTGERSEGLPSSRPAPDRTQGGYEEDDDGRSVLSRDLRNEPQAAPSREQEHPANRNENPGHPSYYDNDDARSEASFYNFSGPRTEELYLACFHQSSAKILEALAHSCRRNILAEILSAKSDNMGENWKSRSFWTEQVIKPWARKINTARSEKAVSGFLRDLERLKFPTKLKADSKKEQGEVWQEFRSELITNLRDCFIAGCPWMQMLQRMLNASKRKLTGNPRVEGLVREALSDAALLEDELDKGGGYALLGADCLIWLLDDSYQTESHGPQAAQNSWAKCTKIEEGEDFSLMGVRVANAYSKFTGLTVSAVHQDDHHRSILFERMGICLQTHTAGERVYECWMQGVRCFEQAVMMGNRSKLEMTVERIICEYVNTNMTQIEGIVTRLRLGNATTGLHTPREPRRSGRTREYPALREPLGVNVAIDEGYEEQDDLAQPAGAVTPGPPSGYQRVPPPAAYTNLSDRQKRWGRECAPPQGNKGHPLGKPWDETSWNKCAIDYERVIRLASDPKYQSLMARFIPSSGDMKTCRLSMPHKIGENWGQYACLFCAHRPVNYPTPHGCGNGMGNHGPATCRTAKRWLAEGGDPQHSRMVKELQQCLFFPPPRSRTANPRPTK